MRVAIGAYLVVFGPRFFLFAWSTLIFGLFSRVFSAHNSFRTHLGFAQDWVRMRSGSAQEFRLLDFRVLIPVSDPLFPGPFGRAWRRFVPVLSRFSTGKSVACRGLSWFLRFLGWDFRVGGHGEFRRKHAQCATPPHFFLPLLRIGAVAVSPLFPMARAVRARSRPACLGSCGCCASGAYSLHSGMPEAPLAGRDVVQP